MRKEDATPGPRLVFSARYTFASRSYDPPPTVFGPLPFAPRETGGTLTPSKGPEERKMEPLTGEREWIRKFQSGDASAFVAIMNHYEPYILGLLTRLAGDRARAEDLCQETFLKALKGLPSFRRDSSLKTWLFRIAHNTAMDQARADGPGTDSLDEREEGGLKPAARPQAPRPELEAQMRGAVEEGYGLLAPIPARGPPPVLLGRAICWRNRGRPACLRAP